MAICVYHNLDFLKFYRQAGEGTPDRRRLYLAAIVDTDEPEIAYRFTQHLGMAWFEHPNVRTVVRSRSTSVGDVLQTEDGRLLQVAPFGFREIAGEKLPAQHSNLVQALRTMTSRSREITEHQKLITQVGHLYTALLFAAAVLEAVSEEAPPDPDRALLARFAAEQARWALGQADGG